MSIDHSRLAVGFRVRGVGTKDTAEGAVWYRGGIADSNLPSDYEWLDELAEIPGSIPAGTDIRTGAIQTNDYGIPLHNHEKVAETFQNEATRSTAELSADVSDTQTTIPTSDSTLANTTVYIGTETILLGSYDSNNNEYTGCSRGRRGSTATEHTSGEQIYDQVPVWRGRLVDLIYVRDDLGTANSDVERRWTGYIRDIGEDTSGLVLGIETGHILERIQEAKVGKSRTPINDRGAQWSEIGPRTLTLSPPARPTPAQTAYNSEVRKSGAWNDPWPLVVDAEKGLYFVDDDQTLDRAPQFGSESEVEATDAGKLRTLDADKYQVYELAAFGTRIEDTAADLNVTDPVPTQALDTINFTNGNVPDKANHIVGIALALLCSENRDQEYAGLYDVMDAQYGLHLWDFVDIGSLEGVMLEVPSRTVDQWIWGWRGESERVWPKLSSALRGEGIYWSIQQTGDIGMTRFTVADIGEADTQLGQKMTVLQRLDDHLLQREESRSSEVDTLQVKIGNWPWVDPKGLEFQETGTPGRAQAIASGDTVTFDLGHRSLDREREAIARMKNRLRKHHVIMPSLTVRVPDPTLPGESGPSLDIGQLVALEDLGLAPGTKHIVDNNGNRVQFDGSKIQYLARIEAREHEIRSGTYKLTLRLVNYTLGSVVRERAPSMEITDDNSGGNDDKVYCAATSQFGANTSDNRTFTVGQRIQITDPQGVHKGGPYEISGIGSDGTGEYIQISGTFGLGGAVDDMVRLSNYDDYDDNASAGELSNLSGVKWCYFADSSENLGDENADAHIYGV